MSNAYQLENTVWENRVVGHDTVPADSLLANPLNFRIHSKIQQDAIAGLLGEVGWVKSVVVNKVTGHIVDGHARVTLALRNDSPVPVEYVELSEEEERLALVSLDNIVGMAGTDKEQLDNLLREVSTGDEALMGMLSEMAEESGLYFGDEPPEESDAEPQVNRADELREKWGVETGQMWRLPSRVEGQEHRLICGDCTDAAVVERVMGGERAVLCFTSPPYFDIREYDGGDLSVENLAQFIPVASEYVKYFCVNLGIKRAGGEIVPYWDIYTQKARDVELKMLSWNVWDQGQVGSVGKLTAMFPIEHEFIFVYGVNRTELNCIVPNKDAGSIDRHVSDRQADGRTEKKRAIKIRSHRELGTVARCSPQLARDITTAHSAPFPIELAEMYLNSFGAAGEVVYEPFSGSGTTIIAAENLQRQCRAVEISPAYVAVSLQRYEDAFGITPELVTDSR